MSDLESLIGARARDENGRFVSVTPTEEPEVKAKEPTQVAPVETKAEPAPKPAELVAPVAVVKPPEPQATNVPLASLLDEREKRQAAERRAQEHEQRLRELEAERAKAAEPQIDPYQDLPGYLQKNRQEIQQELHRERVLMSEDMARAKYTDFEPVVGEFLKAAESNPALIAQMNAQRNPAEFAYRQGLLHRELAAVNGDPVAYRAKVRAEVEAELAAKAAPVVPTSLNSETSPVAATEVYAGPPPLKSLLRINDSRR